MGVWEKHVRKNKTGKKRRCYKRLSASHGVGYLLKLLKIKVLIDWKEADD